MVDTNEIIPFTNKELSWLSFNARVLQEAKDPTVPLLERVRFLGIFSSNQDEFYRVRVAMLHRLASLRKRARLIIGHDPKQVLLELQNKILAQQVEFQATYDGLLHELKASGIHVVDEKALDARQGEFVRDYFQREVRSKLTPLMLRRGGKFPDLVDKSIYLATRLVTGGDRRNRFALIEVPNTLSRFVLLPKKSGAEYVMLLEDVIRFNLRTIFSIFEFERIESHIIKLTRDAELDLDDDVSESYIEKVSKGIRHRQEGNPVRLVYDANLSPEFLKFLRMKLKFRRDDKLIPGGRYHNFKDFMSFPAVGGELHRYPSVEPAAVDYLHGPTSLFPLLKKKDVLLHFPYQRFDYVTDLLREAAIDPKVTEIQMCLYRVAKNSDVVNALTNAARNGKSVTVVIELQARFDEAANVALANQLKAEGAQVVFGVPGLKVHSKLGLITRRVKGRAERFALLGTGNFNESTALLYSDHCLLTADRNLTKEVQRVFDFLNDNYRVSTFNHLILSPFGLRDWIGRMIRREIKNAKKGREAWITLKLNNLTDPNIIGQLYKAADAGVKLRLLVRGMFSLQVDAVKREENIEAIGIIDRFLEHSRILAFANGGNPEYFLTSADWMRRNLDRRVEVTFPIYSEVTKRQLSDYLEVQWRDNVKARVLNRTLDNQYRKRIGDLFRSQDELARYTQNLKLVPGRGRARVVPMTRTSGETRQV